jgi:hypothetical protein
MQRQNPKAAKSNARSNCQPGQAQFTKFVCDSNLAGSVFKLSESKDNMSA